MSVYNWGASFDTQAREFYRFVAHGGQEAKWSGDEAREVLAFIEAAYESSAKNAPVRLSPPV